MPEVVASGSELPSNTLATVDSAVKDEAALKQQTKRTSKEFGDQFTFHPRVSTASSRIVESSGMNFIARQQRHVERQKKLHHEYQSAQSYGNSQCDVTPKRQKINDGATTTPVSLNRPYTSDKNLLKKRSRMSKNSLRSRSKVLEEMDIGNRRSPLPNSSTPSLPPRAKTYYSPLSAASGVYSTVPSRKKSISDPYGNFDRLQRAKMIAEKAIKSKKIFSIHGPYPLIRKALRERGWVEKEFKLPAKMKLNSKASGDSSDVDDDYDDDDDDDTNQKDSGIGMSPRPFEATSTENEENEPNDCYGIMGRLVRNEPSVFQWTTRTASIDWRFLQKDQIVNHFAKANFTTKVGLCMNLRMLSCYTDGHCDKFFPRCYRLSNEEDKCDFIDDFRLTAASSMLKIVISRHVDENHGQGKEKIENGQAAPPGGSHIIPADILLFAIKVCNMYTEERNHEDIDKDNSLLEISPASWDQLIFHYSKLVHDGATIPQSGSYFKQCEQALAGIKDKAPQFFIEGVKNTWIVKPGAKSRGRGIVVMNNIDEILKLVAGDCTLIKDSRWVVQKYIERPLLVYATKFDVRQWFLVTDWNPVTIWIYRESYLRFSSRPFSLKCLEPCIHLCNHSVQKHFDVASNRHPLVPADNMWSDADFREYLKTRGCHTLWDDRIFPGMKKAIIHVCQTAQDTVEYRKGSFELYGADFMIDENYNTWLIEVNSSPTMSRSTSITSKLCASVQEDTLKVVLDRKKDKHCDIGQFELIYKQPTVDIPLYVGKALQVEGTTIKKPYNSNRRSLASLASVSSNNSNGSNNHTNSQHSSDSQQSFVNKSLNRAASIYAQSGTNYNRPAKVGLQSSNNSSSISNRNHSNEMGNKVHTNRLLTDRANGSVKIKMQSTLQRLSSETQNTPSKPNAFSLPKCASNSTLTSTTGGSNMPASTVSSSQGILTKISSHTRKTNNAMVPVVKLPCNIDSHGQSATSNTVHFVSSSQAKAASAVGIMHLGSSFNSMIAAANRGCLPGKFSHPYASPQAVMPKTFPMSFVPGGNVMAGGNTMNHPPPPPGIMAVTPQTIGLGLPFQKYFNMHSESASVSNGGQPSLNRRGLYGGQDLRFGAPPPRISGRLY